MTRFVLVHRRRGRVVQALVISSLHPMYDASLRPLTAPL